MGDLSQLTDERLQSLILLARDHVIEGWVLASGSFMAIAALSVVLRGLNGRDMILPVGQELASAGPLNAVYRLADAARRDPNVLRILAGGGDHLDELSAQAPEFHRAVLAELKSFGHRGPGELEMRSFSYADDPELLLRMVAKSLDTPVRSEASRPVIPLRARPVASLAAHQVRDREVRRDRMVRAIWLLRSLLRELGRRLVDSGVIETVDDVFYLLVDELDALPADVAGLVARRRAEQTQARGRGAARRLQRRLAGRHRRGNCACPRAGADGSRRERRAESADGSGSSGPKPSTTWKPARSWSPKSPTWVTPPRSPTRAPS